MYFLEFLYCKSVPLFSGSEYSNFGIPTLHVFIVTISCYFVLIHGFQYTIFKNKKDLIKSLFAIAYFILIFSRGILLFVTSIIIILSLFDKKIKIKHIFVVLVMLIIVSWLFGILGNIRSGYSWNDSHIILYHSQISYNRYSLFAPFFWVEEYIVCSLRNLNYNIINFSYDYSFLGFLYSIIPDFLSKRMFNHGINTPNLIVNAFTTSTMYANVYVNFKYFGMLFNYIIYFIIYFVFVNVKMVDISNKIIGFSILSLLFAFSIFSDMIWYSGYSFVLVYCLIFGIFPSLQNQIPKIIIKH